MLGFAQRFSEIARVAVVDVEGGEFAIALTAMVRELSPAAWPRWNLGGFVSGLHVHVAARDAAFARKLVRLLGGFELDCGEPFDPCAQVAGQHERAPAALHFAKVPDLIAW